MQVEDVARVRLTTRRAAQQQGHLPVGVRVLGQVVVDGESRLAVVEEVLGHRAPGVRRQERDRGGLVSGSHHDDRVLQRAGVLERLGELHDGGLALADRDIHADQVAVLVVDDRVDRDRRLAGLAVADDELPLATADRDHRVDRLEARQHRLLDRLALDDAGGLVLDRARPCAVDLALAVERVAERIDDPAEHRVSDGDLEQALGALDRVTLGDLLPTAEEHGADVVGLEVQRQPDHVVWQLEHLERHAVLETVDPADAVCDGQDRSDLGEVGTGRVETLDPTLQD